MTTNLSGSDFDFSKFEFHPVIKLPENYDVLDLSTPGSRGERTSDFSIGRYNEKREGMYTSEIFENARNVHVGIDIGGPVGTTVFAPYAAKVFAIKEHKEDGNYGPTIVLEHDLKGRLLYTLFGHLGRECLDSLKAGVLVQAGDAIATIGSEYVNGGWPPHLHFQLSWEAPQNCDMPGVVSVEDRDNALRLYPDPQQILGKLY